MTLSKVNELDIQAIEKLKQQYGIEAIILDVDDTLRKKMKDIPKCNKDLLNQIINEILKRDDLFESKKNEFIKKLKIFKEKYNV